MKEVKKVQAAILSDYSRSVDKIFRTVEEGKENIGTSLMNEQYNLVDELRCDIETKREDFDNDATKKRRPAIDVRKAAVINTSDDFNQLAKLAFLSTAALTSKIEEDTERFGKETIHVWV